MVSKKFSDVGHSSDNWLAHWNAYRSQDQSPISGKISDATSKKSIRSEIGDYFCGSGSESASAEDQIKTSNAIKEAVKALLKENSILLLDWDVVDEILSLRFVAEDWEPIALDAYDEKRIVVQRRLEDYAERRKFLLSFFDELAELFAYHVESTVLELAEALWLREFWSRVHNCLIVEVYEPESVEFENEAFGDRPASYTSNIFKFRFVRDPNPPTFSTEQKAPWIDQLLLRLISRMWMFLNHTKNEVDAAINLQEGYPTQKVEFRFYSNAQERAQRSNQLTQEIDIRYFGKSTERAIDRYLIAVLEYLVESGSVGDKSVTREQMHTLYGLLTEYVASAKKLPREILKSEVYFRPPEEFSISKPLAAPRISVLPDSEKINPSRDVSAVIASLEAIQ